MKRREQERFACEFADNPDLSYGDRLRIDSIMIPFAGNQFDPDLLFDGCLCVRRILRWPGIVIIDKDDFIVQKEFDSHEESIRFYLRMPSVLTWEYIWVLFG